MEIDTKTELKEYCKPTLIVLDASATAGQKVITTPGEVNFGTFGFGSPS